MVLAPAGGQRSKSALITGASSAIGRATALGFGREGLQVGASARRPDGLVRVVQQIGLKCGHAKAFPADIDDLIHYLASEEASWMTGVTVPIDGDRARICAR